MKKRFALIVCSLAMVCWSGMALAAVGPVITTLTFDNVNQEFDGDLDRYSAFHGITLEGFGYFTDEDTDLGAVNLNFLKTTVDGKAEITFYNPVHLYSFSFASEVKTNAVAGYTADNQEIFNLELPVNKGFLDLSSWSGTLLSSIVFTVKNNSAVFVDDVSFTAAAPLPGAALLFGSGLLGLVGLRRRAIV